MHQIVFTRGTTESDQPGRAELRAASTLQAGDEMLSPRWSTTRTSCRGRSLCEQTGAQAASWLRSTTPASSTWTRSSEALRARTKIVAVVHVSNALGTINPGEEIARLAHAARRGRAGRRRAGHAALRSTCETSTATSTRSRATRSTARPASACSTARSDLLETMPPWQGGGEMILSVSFEKTTYNELPYKFEAGTPDDRRRHRARRGHRLSRGLRPRRARRARARSARVRRRGARDRSPELRIVGTAKEKTGCTRS